MVFTPHEFLNHPARTLDLSDVETPHVTKKNSLTCNKEKTIFSFKTSGTEDKQCAVLETTSSSCLDKKYHNIVQTYSIPRGAKIIEKWYMAKCGWSHLEKFTHVSLAVPH